jgi:hypothetical protein
VLVAVDGINVRSGLTEVPENIGSKLISLYRATARLQSTRAGDETGVMTPLAGIISRARTAGDAHAGRLFALALVAGVALRFAAIPMGGTHYEFKGWSYVAATRGEARLYDWAGAPQDLRLRSVDGFYAQGDYPPAALYVLGYAGRAYHWVSGGRFLQTDAFTAAIKTPALLAEALLGLLLFVMVRRTVGLAPARRVALVYWLNPAMILSTSVFGGIDTLFALPAIGALIAGAAGWPALAGCLIAIAALTKPQALVVVPVVMIAIWNGARGDRPSLVRSALAGALTSAVLLTPIVAAGAAMNMTLAVGSIVLGADVLSQACNLWWIAGHALRLAQMPGLDLTSALTMPVTGMAISTFADFDLPIVRIVVRFLGSTFALAAIGWGAWTVRHERDVSLLAAAAAFLVHAYVVLATQVHENHLFAAMPFLALAAARRPQFFPVFVAISAVFALNMNLLYGLGRDDLRYALPRTMAGVDLTLAVAVANCAILARFAQVLRRESARTLPAL